MSKAQKETKQLSVEEKRLLQQKQTKNSEIVCTILMMFLGLVTSQKFLSFFFQKQRFPPNYQPPTLFVFFALVSGFVFVLTLCTVALRVITRKGLPAEREDPPSIKSVNQAIKNTIVYTVIFLGMYNYLLQNWKEDEFILHMSPFVLFGLLVLEFALRITEFIVGAKGFRYLAQAIIIFLLSMLAMDCIKVSGNQTLVVQ